MALTKRWPDDLLSTPIDEDEHTRPAIPGTHYLVTMDKELQRALYNALANNPEAVLQILQALADDTVAGFEFKATKEPVTLSWQK